MNNFSFPISDETAQESALRNDVRNFLASEIAQGHFTPSADCWTSTASPEFSKKLGERGWLGMTWPKQYGGHERPAMDRYIVTEELLTAGAPVAAHWIADRQTGGQILKFGTQEQKQKILPAMARGECFSCIGMSEPQAGSDLAAVRTKAEATDNGWLLNGRKIWTTVAHLSSYMIVLARTSPAEGRNRQVGLSQFLVDLSLPGIEVSGIRDLEGNVHFNEVVFDNVRLHKDALLGQEGNGWEQCMGELATERSGSERFLTTFVLLEHAVKELGGKLPPATVGRLIAELKTLRIMSRGVARRIDNGESVDTEAALVKQLGNAYEKFLFTEVRSAISAHGDIPLSNHLRTLYQQTQLRLPSHSLRGGTTEILRGIIARHLGVR